MAVEPLSGDQLPVREPNVAGVVLTETVNGSEP
jgi:hypothetical protein